MLSYNFRFLLFLTLIITFCNKFCLTNNVKFITNTKEIEDKYVLFFKNGIKEFYTNEKPYNDFICDLPKEKKLAICKLIIEEHDEEIYRFNPTHKIYINYTAASNSDFQCQNKYIDFQHYETYNNKFILVPMYPCYARHNPMRTSWSEDEYLYRIFVSGGCSGKCLFVYTHELNVIHDEEFNYPMTIIEDLNIETLNSELITEENLEAEQQSLQQMFFNVGIPEIELYLLKDASSRHSKFRRDKICDLDNEKKLTLCKNLLTRDFYKNTFHWVVDDEKFNRDNECVLKEINLSYLKEEAKGISVSKKMFYCYGKFTDILNDEMKNIAIPSLFISQGYKKNSVLVLMVTSNADGKLSLSVVESIENVNIDDLQPTEIPVSEKSEPINQNEVQKIEINQEEGINKTEKNLEENTDKVEEYFGEKIDRDKENQEKTDTKVDDSRINCTEFLCFLKNVLFPFTVKNKND